jgi:hypothetical protein
MQYYGCLETTLTVQNIIHTKRINLVNENGEFDIKIIILFDLPSYLINNKITTSTEYFTMIG